MNKVILFLMFLLYRTHFNAQNFPEGLKSKIDFKSIDSERVIITLDGIEIGRANFSKGSIGPKLTFKGGEYLLDSSLNVYSSEKNKYYPYEYLIKEKRYYNKLKKVKVLELELLNVEDTFIAENDSIWKHIERFKEPIDKSMSAVGSLIRKIKFGRSISILENYNFETKKTELISAVGESEPYDISFTYSYNSNEKLFEVKLWKRYYKEAVIQNNKELLLLEKIKSNYLDLKSYANDFFKSK